MSFLMTFVYLRFKSTLTLIFTALLRYFFSSLMFSLHKFFHLHPVKNDDSVGFWCCFLYASPCLLAAMLLSGNIPVDCFCLVYVLLTDSTFVL